MADQIKTWQERRYEEYGLRADGYQAEPFMLDEIDELRAALQAQQGDALDAERYRWLREKRDIPHGARNIPWVVALDPKESIHTMILRIGEELDGAIDAAILAAAGHKGDSNV